MHIIMYINALVWTEQPAKKERVKLAQPPFCHNYEIGGVSKALHGKILPRH